MSAVLKTHFAADHLIQRLMDAEVNPDPYPHTYITRAFPKQYYDLMLEELPPDEVYRDHTFDNRMMVRTQELGPFWTDLTDWMLSNEVIQSVLGIFKIKAYGLKADVRLVRDSKGYKIKPHTDIKAKVLSLLFYLAPDEENPGGGTTVMVPKDKSFTSPGTARYPFEDFEDVYTAPFLPNTMLGFPRSDVSFHGVHPTSLERRDVLLLNLYR